MIFQSTAKEKHEKQPVACEGRELKEGKTCGAVDVDWNRLSPFNQVGNQRQQDRTLISQIRWLLSFIQKVLKGCVYIIQASNWTNYTTTAPVDGDLKEFSHFDESRQCFGHCKMQSLDPIWSLYRKKKLYLLFRQKKGLVILSLSLLFTTPITSHPRYFKNRGSISDIICTKGDFFFKQKKKKNKKL